MKEDNKVKYNCDKCNFKCKFESQWKKHIDTELHKTGIKKIRSDTKEPYKCDKCLYETKNIIMFKQHKLTEHGTKEERKNDFKYYCESCDIGTFSKIVFENHNKSNKHIKYAEKQNNNV